MFETRTISLHPQPTYRLGCPIGMGERTDPERPNLIRRAGAEALGAFALIDELDAQQSPLGG